MSITATPPPSIPRDDVPKNFQCHLDQVQRHPLPARPLVEVCLNGGSQPESRLTLPEAEKLQSDLQSTRSEPEKSQRTVPLQQLPSKSCPGDAVQTQDIPATMHIDPAILYDGSSPHTEHEPEVATYLNATVLDICPSPEPPIINTDLTPRSTQHNAEDTVKSNRQTPRVMKRPYTRKRATGKGPNRLPKIGVSSRKTFSFSSLRSYFLAIPAEERLQFLSWLFEGSLQHYVSLSTSDFPHYASTLELAHEERPSEGEVCRPVDNNQLEYEVDKILRHREDAHGSISYLVKWKGYEELEAT
ncbi:uncharacterized protein N7498_001765 [Penicillium cinerascens]|uniref:Chromo domain-containing protein n=1 Tax=Penicillium cinerascens TaxID=70096 RepID=A0A9W9TA96_9EURO|nr:uncharacterized protein N7498_001765 [Penicillium cinerascens]KAJ5215358.1 hypothetical protein N7498_001765 [Penicillium cinerascens]